MTSADENLLEMLTQRLAGYRENAVPRPAGLVYDWPEAFVIEHGRPWTPQQLPDEFQPMPEKECFYNASHLVAGAEGLTYCEGFALGSGVAIDVVHHAWAADSEGRVIDVTWPEPGAAYRGVAFPLEFIADALVNGTGSLLNDWERDFPLLRSRWTGETPTEKYQRVLRGAIPGFDAMDDEQRGAKIKRLWDEGAPETRGLDDLADEAERMEEAVDELG